MKCDMCGIKIKLNVNVTADKKHYCTDCRIDKNISADKITSYNYNGENWVKSQWDVDGNLQKTKFHL